MLFGKLGLPIPFRQRLMYVMGKTIFPPALEIADNANETADGEFEQKVQEMHDAFCDEVIRIFENNKEYYGWGDKTLRLV